MLFIQANPGRKRLSPYLFRDDRGGRGSIRHDALVFAELRRRRLACWRCRYFSRNRRVNPCAISRNLALRMHRAPVIFRFIHFDPPSLSPSRLQKLRAKPLFSRGSHLGKGSTPSVESKAMRRAKQQCLTVRSLWAFTVLSLIALLLVLSVATASAAGHGFNQISLALPIFFVFLFLATSIGDWLQVEDLFTEPKSRFSTSLTRAPPA